MLVLLLAGTMLVVAVASVWQHLTAPSDGSRAAYVTTSLSRTGLGVDPLPGADTPLAANDRVTAIEDIGLDAWLDQTIGGERLGARSGDTLLYTVTRDGTTVELEVPLGSYPLGAVLVESWSTLLFCALMLLVAAYVYVRQPAASAAAPLLLVGTGLAGSTVPWLFGIQALDIAGGVGFWLWLAGAFIAYSVFWSAALHFALVFPRRLEIVRRLPGGVAVVYLLPLGLMAAWIVVGVGVTGHALDALGSATTLQLVLVVVICAALIGLLVVQYRTATDALTRLQVRWIAWAGGIAVALAAACWFVPELVIGHPILPWSAVGITGLPVPTAVAIAVLRHRLFDIDVVINRSLVYGALTALVVAVYLAIVGILGVVLRYQGSFPISLLATGVAALVALPMRDRLQLATNRLMYGDRDDPYRAITRLGERLSTSLTTQEVLPIVVATVAGALRLPYVAIELGHAGEMTIAAATGAAPDVELLRTPLVDSGEQIGDLVVAERTPREGFSHADRALLAGLAREAGRAVRSVGLTAEIERSRRQLVAAREEERRRLRRDLHDGLGPTLAGARLKLQAARSLAASWPADATSLMDALDGELASVLNDVRRISRDLRPPALDELGLMPALRAQAARFAVDEAIDIRVEGPADLPPLTAAVEAAAYRIALEALTNVRRHSGARHCALRVGLGDGLELEVEDDGTGLALGTRSGVGLTAMRERAVEVGGSCEIGARVGGAGTRVFARLPLGAGGST